MIFTEALDKGSHLGSEFLTWLWWMADKGESVNVSGEVPIICELCGDIKLDGPDKQDRVTVKGETSQYREGLAALQEHKAPTSARFLISQGNDSFEVTLDATWFTAKSLKSLTQRPGKDDEPTPEADLLDAVGFVEWAYESVDKLFRAFMELRTHAGWHQAWRDISAWAREESNA